MITLTEEAYDGAVGSSLVAALLDDLNQRYNAESEGMTPEEIAAEDAEYLAEVTPELVSPPLGTFVVARLSGRPVGCGALKPLWGAPGVAEVKRMYTVPEARRRGVSRVILARLEAVAVELGYCRIQLETGAEQPEAVRLYETAGWHCIEPYGRYRDSPSSLCFAKDLPGR